MTQSCAVNIVSLLKSVDRRYEGTPLKQQLSSMFDTWLAIEHNEVWKAKERDEELQRQDDDSYVDFGDLSADDMGDMIAKMRALSAGEGGMDSSPQS